MTSTLPGVTTETARLDAIKARLAAVPPGQWSWRGNTDYPDTLHLASSSWTGADGEHHFGRNIIGTVRHELTERDAHLAGVGSSDFWPAPEFMSVEEYEKTFVPPEQDTPEVDSDNEYPTDITDTPEYEKALDNAYEDALEAHRAAHKAEVVHDWLHDEFGERRHVERLAFTDEHGFLVEADTLAIFEVAPNATSPDDPKVYRRDIVGFRHPVAEFLATARADMDFLVAEVERLRAREQRALAEH